ncbi:sulfotransferase family protein [Fulvivirga lutea]|uniref:Sulfotransferase n=1 Tax=Fulvivirga lutea TaxID=2810512 RepID=A0A974WEY7_9BACT|nr:sulfotransferase [Fulvivirga lutea]QSE97183.1 sulfotransferase [Fulvivirga lutea]
MNKGINVNPLIILYNRLRILNPFRKSIPLKTAKDTYQPFLIIGSGRSGTTLLRSMLNQSNEVEIPPESFVLPRILKRYKVYNKLPWNDFLKIILGEFSTHPQFQYWNLNLTNTFAELAGVPKSEQSLFKIIDTLYTSYTTFKNKPGAKWGDKTPLNTYHLTLIDKIVNKPKYINIIRDGRDVVASYLKADLAENIDDACNRWRDAIIAVQQFEKRNSNRVLSIRYEALVTNPENELRKVCDFLEVEFENNMLQNNRNSEALGDSVYSHHENLKKPIDTSSIGKWKSNLSTDQMTKVDTLISTELKKLGYTD